MPRRDPAAPRRQRRRTSILATLALAALLCAVQVPVLAQLAAPRSAQGLAQGLAQISAQTAPIFSQGSEPAALFGQGQAQYQAGEYAAAIASLTQAIQGYQTSGNRLGQAIALGNLSLAQQKLSQWPQASQAIEQSLALLPQTQADDRTRAALLDIQGSLQLETGQAQAALDTWQRSAQAYEALGDRDALARNRINQAQALRILGFYRRALELLTTAPALLEAEPDSLTKATRLRLLGDALRLSGQGIPARAQLQASLQVAQAVGDPGAISAAYLGLANLDRAEKRWDAKAKAPIASDNPALENYIQAAATAPSPGEALQIRATQFSLLVEQNLLADETPGADPTPAARQKRWGEALNLWRELRPQLDQLPTNRSGIYSLVHVVQSALEAPPEDLAIAATELLPLLQRAIAQAEQLDDSRARAHALGSLGHLYEVNRRWPEATQITQRALQQAQLLDAPDISYQLNWQLGRLLSEQDQIEPAIGAYDAAIAT
ncbi:MAG: tetratricopeptide repeat protein [Synechococcales cyanobacterium RM1_1_8]|nr:tetratricopeptide repeat protein [Synechococcales cyanobacterium RM1_1_8]